MNISDLTPDHPLYPLFYADAWELPAKAQAELYNQYYSVGSEIERGGRNYVVTAPADWHNNGGKERVFIRVRPLYDSVAMGMPMEVLISPNPKSSQYVELDTHKYLIPQDAPRVISPEVAVAMVAAYEKAIIKAQNGE